MGKGVTFEVKYNAHLYIGNNTEILQNTFIRVFYGELKIGENCSINPNCLIYSLSKVIIGNNVLIAGATAIVGFSHVFKERSVEIRLQGYESKGIIIEDNVWIGHGCSILDGVKIGQGAVIGAGSVVNKDIPAYTVFAGVPAKIIR